MTNQEIKQYLEEHVNVDKLYEQARKKLAERIIKDETFLEDYMSIVENFRSADSMFKHLVKDAQDAGLEESELDAFPGEWLSYILRI